MVRWVEPLCWWAVLFGCYLILISSVSLTELVVGAAAATVATATAITARRTLFSSLSEAGEDAVGARLAWGGRAALHGLAVLPRQIVTDTARLARPPWPTDGFGRLELPRAAESARLRDSTQRGLITLLISASPGAYVTDVDPGRGVLTVHRIDPRPGPLERSVTKR
jgi:hypothetical protein